jgi:hypothetical protein
MIFETKAFSTVVNQILIKAFKPMADAHKARRDKTLFMHAIAEHNAKSYRKQVK